MQSANKQMKQIERLFIHANQKTERNHSFPTQYTTVPTRHSTRIVEYERGRGRRKADLGELLTVEAILTLGDLPTEALRPLPRECEAQKTASGRSANLEAITQSRSFSLSPLLLVRLNQKEPKNK
ncbi:hypothetical protein HPP92_006977 [Vanilla planifolia]|uniref:Uncharacterized protein n=1 Tax=Vanilla planifolia TaxID=51239 RepID=A0A835R9B1_VANPL|nr:hypothetical protein HPP92_006977 [Vanilla planifolia]